MPSAPGASPTCDEEKETTMAAVLPPVEVLRAGRYVKSSYSPEQTDCVMLCAAAGWVGLQDSKEYSSTPRSERMTLAFTVDRFAAFLKDAKAGKFDHSIM
jgi:hypothetical protein